jgi:hypothetical protein
MCTQGPQGDNGSGSTWHPQQNEHKPMPSDETRKLLRSFGVAITTLEDAVHGKAAAEEIAEAERQARRLLTEVTALIERLQQGSNSAK